MTTTLTVAASGQYSLSQVARVLDVDRSTVYRWVRAGYLRVKYHRYNKRPYVEGRELERFYKSIY